MAQEPFPKIADSAGVIGVLLLIERTVLRRHRVVRSALEDRDVVGVTRQRGHRLDARGASSDDGDAFTCRVHMVCWPV